MIGAGNFAALVLLPALRKTPAVLKSIASAGGTSAALAARKFGFAQATTDYRVLLEDPEINTLFIATRHNLHARLVIEALQAGKHVFVEKPLALNRAELQAVAAAYQDAHISEMEPQDGHPTGNSQLASRISQPASRNSQPATRNPQLATRNSPPSLLVGFNRRFSPLAIKMRALLQARSQPVSVIYTVNAGEIPAGHWVHDPQVGGGRIIGEGCHFIDLLRYLVAAPIVGVEAQMMGAAAGVVVREDKMTIQLAFEDGSMGTVHYLANGSKRYPKERVEVFSEGRVLVLDNFKTLQGYGWSGFARQRLWRQDKGHAAEVAAFVERVINGGEGLIPWQELEEVTLASFAAVAAAAKPLEALFDAGGSLCPLQAA